MITFDFYFAESYEDLIINRQESEADDCAHCEYRTCCRNQCMEIEEHYNPNL